MVLLQSLLGFEHGKHDALRCRGLLHWIGAVGNALSAFFIPSERCVPEYLSCSCVALGQCL